MQTSLVNAQLTQTVENKYTPRHQKNLILHPTKIHIKFLSFLFVCENDYNIHYSKKCAKENEQVLNNCWMQE